MAEPAEPEVRQLHKPASRAGRPLEPYPRRAAQKPEAEPEGEEDNALAAEEEAQVRRRRLPLGRCVAAAKRGAVGAEPLRRWRRWTLRRSSSWRR